MKSLEVPDPATARHGLLPGQIDPSARVIWLQERLGLAYDVRWPQPSPDRHPELREYSADRVGCK
jgi:hypothetical protein